MERLSCLWRFSYCEYHYSFENPPEVIIGPIDIDVGSLLLLLGQMIGDVEQITTWAEDGATEDGATDAQL